MFCMFLFLMKIKKIQKKIRKVIVDFFGMNDLLWTQKMIIRFCTIE